MRREYLQPEDAAWNWKEETPFSRSLIIDDQVFISGQVSLNSKGEVLSPDDIGAQTHIVFKNMKQSLAQVGLELSNLVRLNTYYVYEGADEGAQEYWETFTKVRLEYMPNPGPAATAVRIKGMPYKGQVIQIEGVALRCESHKNRQRIMPSGSWNWSIPVPMSQGWKVGNRVFVGGQISSDKRGQSVHVGDVAKQTQEIYKFIGNILEEGGATFDDVTRLKLCFKYGHVTTDGESFSDQIIDVTKEFFKQPAPPLTSFGVDLLYPGLDLEIDAMAIISPDRKALFCPDLGGRYQPDIFADGISAGDEIYVGGQVAIGEDGSVLLDNDISGQAKLVFERLAKVLAQDGATLNDVVKLNLFFVSEDDDVSKYFYATSRVWKELAPNAHPTMTAVNSYEMPRPGVLIQADCVAIK